MLSETLVLPPPKLSRVWLSTDAANNPNSGRSRHFFLLTRATTPRMQDGYTLEQWAPDTLLEALLEPAAVTSFYV